MFLNKLYLRRPALRCRHRIVSNIYSVTMAGFNNKKPQLPQSVLDMKFMRKTKERIQKELENTEDHDSLYSNIITNEMRSATGNYIYESSYLYCEDLMEGRLSFKGMNPEIERLMEVENQPVTKQEDMKKDVSDEVLAKKMIAFNKRKIPYSSPGTVGMKKKKRH